MLDALLSLLWLLLCIVVVLALAYCFTRFVAGGQTGRFLAGMTGSAGRLRLLDQLPLGRDQKVVLVQALERYFVLGVAGSGITVLCELAADELQNWQSKAISETAPAAPPFQEELRKLLRRKDRR